jgi:uncharacterized coiled-coil DUF342 family protein
MNQTNKFLLLLVIGCLGLWGCSQGPANGSASERMRALEVKLARLEDDFKASISAREQLRKKLNAAELERVQLAQKVEQLQVVVKERDELRRQVVSRTSERDSAQAQLDHLRKGIKTLLGQVEVSAGTATQPVGSSSENRTPGKS